ncbi:hypothetical protein [Bacillus sp. AFS040349]|uniref:hypothetical protein n=1 Tax=Bacillus sp. AFS040349 TaxID=2033502 RepID=UPI000BFB6EC7|nr:hypothetical protein [Bacillus sp. AFS040349]PGT83292.1 hypothetical protein COD11_13230 [Bacillus sp. AFS040349]
MSQEVTVTLDLSTITIPLKLEKECSKEDILKLAKEEAIKQLASKFPPLTYNIVEGKALSLNEAKQGMIVKLKDDGEYGIICGVKSTNKLPVSVALSGGRVLKVVPSAIEKASKRVKIEKVILGREKWQRDLGWLEGSTGYFVNGRDISDIIPVVFGKGTKTYHHAIIVDHDAEGRGYKLSAKDLSRVFDTKEDAESYLGKIAKK